MLSSRFAKRFFHALSVVCLTSSIVFLVYCRTRPDIPAYGEMTVRGGQLKAGAVHDVDAGAYGYFGAKLEPGSGAIYHCIQGEVRPSGLFSRYVDWQGVEAYVSATGLRPKLIMHYMTFDPLGFRLLTDTLVDIARKPFDYIPQIGLDFYSYLPGFDILNPRDLTQKIAEGVYDERIKELAGILNNMDRPVFLRPGYEFGGNGQGRHADKRYWVDAWRRIHDIFRAVGAEQIAFVWHTLDAQDFMDYYPGDEYVDWWAVSVFVNDADRDPFLNRFIQSAAQHRKPVMIAEATPRHVGSVGGVSSWAQWYQPAFKLLLAYSHIKAFCYINASWENYPDRSFLYDARIQSDGFIAERFGAMLADPRFIHN